MRGMFALVGLVGLFGCGGPLEEDDRTMFERVDEAKLGYTLAQPLLPGASADILQIASLPEAFSEPFIITLWPGADKSESLIKRPDKVTPIPGLYARIISGNGSAGAASVVEVDFGAGIAFPWRGRSITIQAVNDSLTESPPLGIRAMGVSAFLSRGYFTPQVPQRTKPGFNDTGPGAGQLISLVNPLAAASSAAVVKIPPMAQKLVVLIDPSAILPAPAPYAVSVAFDDAAGINVGSRVVVSGEEVAIPSDAYQVSLFNFGATPLTTVRFVFKLGGF